RPRVQNSKTLHQIQPLSVSPLTRAPARSSQGDHLRLPPTLAPMPRFPTRPVADCGLPRRDCGTPQEHPGPVSSEPSSRLYVVLSLVFGQSESCRRGGRMVGPAADSSPRPRGAHTSLRTDGPAFRRPRSGRLTPARLAVKRVLDVVGACIGLLVLSPV